MKLNYKNVDLEVTVVEEKEKILVKTQNLELAKALREQGVEVLMRHTIDSFVSFYNLTLIDKKKGLVYQNLKTIGRVLKVNQFFAKGKQLYNLSLETPGKRSLFYTTSKEEYKPGDFLYLEGTLEPDAYKNRENRSKLEKIIGFEYYKFNAAKIKLVELELVKKEYKRPRYELHLHTIHSQRDAHITHEQLEHAFEEGKLAVTAITNHGINNCFPDSVHHFGEKSKRKVIPAVEIYAVDDLELKKEQELWELENHEYFQQLEELNQTMEEQELVIETFKTQLETQAVFAKGEKTIIKDQLKLANQTVRDLKKEIKAVEEQVKVLTKTKPSRGDAKRYHLVLLVKSEESTYKDEKYEFAYNPGIYELNKLITAANTEGLAQPVLKKWMGTRPTVSLSDLMKVKEYFVIGGACTSGIVNDALIEGDEEKAKKLIEIFDYLEVQPLMNNVYLTEEPDYKERYPDLESLKQLNRKIYDFAKANGKLVCFTSDAHLMEKEEQFKRALFKKSYISMIVSRSGEDLTKVLSDNREEKQPWLHSYEEMVQELTNQGFSETEIEELYQNEKQIAETCRYFNNTTIFPKQMFIPEFPGVNVKEELPKIVYKNITKIYGPEPDELILARVKEELEALAKRDYEFIYYVSARLVAESEALNYPVGKHHAAHPH